MVELSINICIGSIMHSTCCVQYITRSIILSYVRLSHNTSRSLSENFDFQEARAASLPWKTLYTIFRHRILLPFIHKKGFVIGIQ